MSTTPPRPATTGPSDRPPATSGAEATTGTAGTPTDHRGVTRRRAGWRIVARKEFADHLRSFRFALLVVLLSLTAVASVVAAAGQLRDVASELEGASSVFLRLFTLPLADTPLSFVSFVALIGPLLGIAFGFDAISSERTERTLPRLLSQPVHRDDIVNGKFVAGLTTIALVFAALTMVVAGVGIWRLGTIPSVSDAARLVVWLVVSIVYVGVWLALAILLSVRLRRAATAAMAGIAAWLVLTLFSGLLVGLLADAIAPAGPDAAPDAAMRNSQIERTLGRVSPGFVYEEAIGPLLAPEQRTLAASISPMQAYRAIPGELSLGQSLLLVWPHVVGLVALLVVLFAVAYISFLREEVRA